MRFVLAASMLIGLSACTPGPSPAERALLSVGNPRAAQIEADTQAILRGMEHARSENERLARLSH